MASEKAGKLLKCHECVYFERVMKSRVGGVEVGIGHCDERPENRRGTAEACDRIVLQE